MLTSPHAQDGLRQAQAEREVAIAFLLDASGVGVTESWHFPFVVSLPVLSMSKDRTLNGKEGCVGITRQEL